jgi:membrane protein implicated in regulation of membrane protease activity
MELARMDNKGASPLKIILIVAAVLVAIVFAFFGQLYFLYFAVAAIIVLGLVMLFTRSKTPTD